MRKAGGRERRDYRKRIMSGSSPNEARHRVEPASVSYLPPHTRTLSLFQAHAGSGWSSPFSLFIYNSSIPLLLLLSPSNPQVDYHSSSPNKKCTTVARIHTTSLNGTPVGQSTWLKYLNLNINHHPSHPRPICPPTHSPITPIIIIPQRLTRTVKGSCTIQSGGISQQKNGRSRGGNRGGDRQT